MITEKQTVWCKCRILTTLKPTWLVGLNSAIRFIIIMHHWKTHHRENISGSDHGGIDCRFRCGEQHVADPILLQATDFVSHAQSRADAILSSLVDDAASRIGGNDLRQELPADKACDGSFSAVGASTKSRT